MFSIIETPAAPTPNGHYSQAIAANGFVFVAGQLPVVPGGAGIIPPGIEAQADQAIDNVVAILTATGRGLHLLVNMTVFVTDIGDWPAIDRVCANRLGNHRPARAVFVSAQLHLGARVAIQAIAVAPHEQQGETQ
jgi:2-iminobutanoate/2-iminopropanoate deaminase